MVYIFVFLAVLLSLWLLLYLLGKRLALRDTLKKADAIVCLSGSRGRRKTLHERLDTAIGMYNQGYSDVIIMSGSFSKKTETVFQPFSLAEIEGFIKDGRMPSKAATFALTQ